MDQLFIQYQLRKKNNRQEEKNKYHGNSTNEKEEG